ncbi:MAG: aminotransferase class V-fold PLP-dependent enzyme [Candidatus Dojkabacteria bacterium]
MQNHEIKSQFPIFSNNPGLVYLDNASTTQKPQRVIDSLVDFYTKYNANVHRGLYPIAEKATNMYEEARKTLAKFINADPLEIIFTGGTTSGTNAIADSLFKSGLIPENPRVLLSDLEHHSSMLPWQQVPGAQLQYLPVNENYEISGISSQLSEKYDVVSLSHVSNVTGSVLNSDILKNLKTVNSKPITVLDCAQSISHLPIDVKSLGADFIVFSGHKIYGPTGVGIIWGRRELLEKMEPFDVGGGMIREVKRDKTEWAPLPEKFEAGTPPIAEAIALAEAVKFVQELGFEQIESHEQELRKELINELSKIEKLKIYHPNLEHKAAGVISFSVDGVHPHDLSQYLGDNNICVRAGHHCTQILHKEVFDISATLRVSLGVYNSSEDISSFIEKLKKGIEVYS